MYVDDSAHDTEINKLDYVLEINMLIILTLFRLLTVLKNIRSINVLW